MRGCWVSASGSSVIFIRDSFFFAILYCNRTHMQEALHTRRMVTTSKDRKKHQELPCPPNTPTPSLLDTSCPLSKGYQDLHSFLCLESLASCGVPCVCSVCVLHMGGTLWCHSVRIDFLLLFHHLLPNGGTPRKFIFSFCCGNPSEQFIGLWVLLQRLLYASMPFDWKDTHISLEYVPKRRMWLVPFE